MKKSFFLIFLNFIAILTFAQGVSDVTSWRQDDSIVVTYDLNADKHYDVRLVYSTDGGDNWNEPSGSLTGDVGGYIQPGTNKRIVWHLGKDSLLPRRRGFRIDAKGKPFLEMIFVKGGTFMMGCTGEQPGCDSDEKPIHKVALDDYCIGKYEVTNAQYCIFLNNSDVSPDGRYRRTAFIHINNSHSQIRHRKGKFEPVPGKEEHPVVEVTWNGASAFCEWAGGRLPTEAEWEYAARGGSKSENYIYSGADTVKKVAWFDRNSDGHAHQVGTKKPNELGIYDMSGNVWEWCFDWYEDYSRSFRNNPRGPKKGHSVVIRGGSWLYYGSFCRVSNRGSSAPGYAFNNYGFRVAEPAKCDEP